VHTCGRGAFNRRHFQEVLMQVYLP
jgi:hypothetical protein